ncbi:hypothetical protein B7494_g3029 [Chlorociboria aeruginascens]|nr:hypothetical protein B7494_g3029 [Chlorociboria aeruginascens]
MYPPLAYQNKPHLYRFRAKSYINSQIHSRAWIENLAVRSDNQLLLTQINPANLYLFNPAKPDPPTLIHTFSSASALTGIVELYPNIFYAVAGNYSITTGNTPGSYSLWKIDFNPPESLPTISKITDLPEAGLPNGVVAIPNENALFIADSANGTIIRFDVLTGTSSVFLSGTDLDPPLPPGSPLGVDGLSIHGKYVYFTDFGEETLYRIPFASNATLPEQISSGFYGDDLDIDEKGSIWVAANFNNEIVVVDQNGEKTTVLGGQDQLTVAGPTSARFGRGSQDKILFVVTCGALVYHGYELIRAGVRLPSTPASIRINAAMAMLPPRRVVPNLFEEVDINVKGMQTHMGFTAQDNAWCGTWEEFFHQGMVRMLAREQVIHSPHAELDAPVEQLYDKVILGLIRSLTLLKFIIPALIYGDLKLLH